MNKATQIITFVGVFLLGFVGAWLADLAVTFLWNTHIVGIFPVGYMGQGDLFGVLFIAVILRVFWATLTNLVK